MKNHDESCTCIICKRMGEGLTEEEAIAESRSWEFGMLAKQGWYAHQILPNPDVETGVDFHTHGLPESWGHPDLQIVFPMPRKLAISVIESAIKLIKSGEKFKDGELRSGIIKEYPVLFIKARESGRDVLRLIIPGPDGKISREEMEYPYNLQFIL